MKRKKTDKIFLIFGFLKDRWYIFILQFFVLLSMKYPYHLEKFPLNVYDLLKLLVEYIFLLAMVFFLFDFFTQDDAYFKTHRRFRITSHFILTIGVILSALGYSYLDYPGISVFLPVSLCNILLGRKAGISSTLYFSMALPMMMNYSHKYSIFFLLIGFATVFMTGNVQKRIDVAKGALFVSLIHGATSILLEQFFNYNMDKISTLISFLNPLVSSIVTIGLLPYVEYVSRIYSNVGLIELGNLGHPLLRELSKKAPGTYQHSSVMANLAEAAAQRIGANYILARVASYFHDIGKVKMPEYFIENQNGVNPHDRKTPEYSHVVLNSHVKYGIELSKKYRLPILVEDIIAQHHGTRVQEYFYGEAKKNNPSVKEDDYRYPGPKPQFKEAGIIMLADAVEASVRSLKDKSVDNIRRTVAKMVNEIYEEGELNESGLTLKDLESIIDEFTKVLSSMYHKRIEYPSNGGEKSDESERAG